MRRRLFNFAAVMSLLLCILTVAFWAESYYVTDDLGWQVPIGSDGYDRWGIKTLDGLAAAHHTVADEGPYSEVGGHRIPTPRGFIKESWALQSSDHSIYSIGTHNALGFGWGRHDRSRFERFRETYAVFPIWIPAVATAIVPIVWVRNRTLRIMRSRKGRCLTCGYNLIGNVSGTCPECGTPVARKAGVKG